jgi:hypothetical protein
VGGNKQIGWIGGEEGFGFEAFNRIIARNRRETKTGKKKKQSMKATQQLLYIHTYRQ